MNPEPEDDAEDTEKKMQVMLELHLEAILDEFPELQSIPRDDAFALFTHGFLHGARYMKEMIAEEIVNDILDELENMGDPSKIQPLPLDPPAPKKPKKKTKKPKKPNS